MRRYRQVTQAEQDLMVHWYIDYGLTLHDLAALFDRKYAIVQRIIAKRRVTRPVGGDRRSDEFRGTPDRRDT